MPGVPPWASHPRPTPPWAPADPVAVRPYRLAVVLPPGHGRPSIQDLSGRGAGDIPVVMLIRFQQLMVMTMAITLASSDSSNCRAASW